MRPVLSLVYASGARPDVDALAALGRDPAGATPFAISHMGDGDPLWLELLVAGLTFDCVGLAPGEPAQAPGAGAMLGLESLPQGEAVGLGPAPHLAGGHGMLPVVRMLAGVGAELARLPGLLAVNWGPSRSWMGPDYFRRIVGGWLQGGPFPALGLTSLHRESDGAMVSVGLAYLIGQELRFEPDRKLAPAAIARIAVRLIHSLLDSGPLRAASAVTGPEGEDLRLEPVSGGRLVRVTLRR